MKRYLALFMQLLLLSAALNAETSKWSGKAVQLQQSIETLKTLTQAYASQETIPGLLVAITQKTVQTTDNLQKLELILIAELQELDTEERQLALDTTAELMLMVADAGELLANRGLEGSKNTIARVYITSYDNYTNLGSVAAVWMKCLKDPYSCFP